MCHHGLSLNICFNLYLSKIEFYRIWNTLKSMLCYCVIMPFWVGVILKLISAVLENSGHVGCLNHRHYCKRLLWSLLHPEVLSSFKCLYFKSFFESLISWDLPTLDCQLSYPLSLSALMCIGQKKMLTLVHVPGCKFQSVQVGGIESECTPPCHPQRSSCSEVTACLLLQCLHLSFKQICWLSVMSQQLMPFLLTIVVSYILNYFWLPL